MDRDRAAAQGLGRARTAARRSGRCRLTRPEGASAVTLEQAARDLARRAGFAHSCSAGTAQLLARLVSRLPAGARLGEAGTGYGVGTAAMAAAMPRDAALVTLERDPSRATAARGLLASDPRVRVRHVDEQSLADFGTFDFVFLDAGPKPSPADVLSLLNVGGIAVVDDFAPSADPRQPMFEGRPDTVRRDYLACADLDYAECGVSSSEAVVVLTRLR